MPGARFLILQIAIATWAIAFDSHACAPINAAISQSNDELNQEEAQRVQLEGFIFKTGVECQKVQAEIARKLSDAAKGESCRGLQENAGLQERLNELSTRCANELSQLENATETFTRQFAEPHESGLAGMLEINSGIPYFQNLCPNEMSELKNLSSRAGALLTASKQTIGKAKENGSKFSKLAAQTKQFQNMSQAAVDRCKQGDTTQTFASLGMGSESIRGSSVPVPTGDSPRSVSAITGETNPTALPPSGAAPKLGHTTLATDTSAQSTSFQGAAEKNPLPSGSSKEINRGLSSLSGHGGSVEPASTETAKAAEEFGGIRSGLGGTRPGVRADEELAVHSLVQGMESLNTVAASEVNSELAEWKRYAEVYAARTQNAAAGKPSPFAQETTLFDRIHNRLRGRMR